MSPTSSRGAVTTGTAAAETRARVMQATIDCILEEGFYRASSNRIATRAGVTWGVIQYHFGTREALLVDVFKDAMQELLGMLQAAKIIGTTFEDRLESLADVIWAFYRQPKFVAYEQLALNLTHDPRTADETLATMARLDSKIGKRLGELVAAVVNDTAAGVLPPGTLLQILRGLAVALVLNEAVPGRAKRSPGKRSGDPERRVLLDALAALVRERRSK
ncbi:MAG: regulatory protein TetR [Acidimicrobiales bacterium]|nr:regulatory protein TetR [Acidimicrobiales bacterium]